MSVFIDNARLVDVDTDRMGACLINEGRIQKVGEAVSCPAHAEVVDAQGRVLMPSVIDPHVHFNDPGRPDWEGVESGSEALLAGGGALYFDMPLNCSPVVTSKKRLLEKATSLTGRSHTNFGLWGGVVPGNQTEWASMFESGAVGLKSFLCHSGLDEFPRTDESLLIEAMKVARDHDGLIAVHAELDAYTLLPEEVGGNDLSAWLRSRPVAAEYAAVEMAISVCRDTGAKLHIVHVSAGSVLELIADAIHEGLPITAETCAHYLFFTEADLKDLGAVGKCTPPLRPQADQDALWKHLHAGTLSWVCSDHSPAPELMKVGSDFFSIWGGISGVQHTLSALLKKGASKECSLSAVSGWVSSGVAERFGLEGRGRLREGAVADLLLLDADAHFRVKADDLKYHHNVSPYVSRELQGTIHTVWQTGDKIWDHGRLIKAGQGEWVRTGKGK